MKIGHYQCEIADGCIERNIDTTLAAIERAEAEGVSILSLPESGLTGYFSNEDDARKHSMELGDPRIDALLTATRDRAITFIVGINERRGTDLYNTAIVAQGGAILGTYSKAFPCYRYFTPGRDFPVFEKDGVTFGVVICADGGYVEPSRILAVRGARVIFAPHYNAIGLDGLLNHFTFVRSDHTARAVENGVWFLRGNNVRVGHADERIAYGDSYLVDPTGEIVGRSQRHAECLITAEIDVQGHSYHRDRSVKSGHALGSILAKALEDAAPIERHFC
ncbi:MAG: carbon-nitrogen hydrolase family protein [Candidatus Poribacteria bacterium]